MQYLECDHRRGPQSSQSPPVLEGLVFRFRSEESNPEKPERSGGKKRFLMTEQSESSELQGILRFPGKSLELTQVSGPIL